MTDLNELKAKAEAATPGPWRVEDSPWMDDFAHWEDCDRAKQVWAQNEDGEDEEMLECNDRANHPGELTGPFTVDVGDYYALSEANADYIAAVSPDVVLKLIAEVERLRADNRAKQLRDALGEWAREAVLELSAEVKRLRKIEIAVQQFRAPSPGMTDLETRVRESLFRNKKYVASVSPKEIWDLIAEIARLIEQLEAMTTGLQEANQTIIELRTELESVREWADKEAEK